MNFSAIFFARNVDVNELNKELASLLDSYTVRIYTSIDSIDNCDPQGLPPHKLHLRLNVVSHYF